MPKKNPAIDKYIAAAAPFARPILKHLRQLVHQACPAIEETIKWSNPAFDYKGMIAGMAAFKEHCAFGFWKESLVFAGEKTRGEAMGQFGRITSVTDLPNDATIIAYVRKAVALNEAGIKVPRPPKTKTVALPVPTDFAAALAKNAKARRTFENFTPGRRNEYIAWLTEAKREATRRQRLATSIEWLAAGKAHNWKYERKAERETPSPPMARSPGGPKIAHKEIHHEKTDSWFGLSPASRLLDPARTPRRARPGPAVTKLRTETPQILPAPKLRHHDRT